MSRFTSRDLVQALLLVIDECVATEGAFTPMPLTSAVLEKVTLLTDHLQASTYGLPGWLVGTRDQTSRGLGGFLSRMDQAVQPGTDWTPWSEHYLTWREADPRLDDDLADLASLHQALLTAPPGPRMHLQLLQDGRYKLERQRLIEWPSYAAATSIKTRQAVEGIAKRARDRGDPLARECGARLLRFDIPIVRDGTTNGLLLGAFLERDPTGTSGLTVGLAPMPSAISTAAEALCRRVDPTSSLDRDLQGTFREGIENGISAAQALLRDLGAESSAASLDRLRFSLTGFLPIGPDGALTGGSAALPVALEAVRLAAPDLPLPRRRLVATGSIDGDGRLVPVNESHLRAKIRAVHDDGMNDGLLALPERGVVPLPGLERLSLEDQTLEAAARILWGERTWQAWCEDQREKANERLGVRVAWTPSTPRDGALTLADGTPIVVHTAVEDSIVEDLSRTVGGQVVAVSGESRSGKSWLGRNVEERLLASPLPWSSTALRVDSHAAPTAQDLADAFNLAIRPRNPKHRYLIVLDDLGGRGQHLGGLLDDVCHLTHASILALVHLDTTPDRSGAVWRKAERIGSRPTIATEQQRVEFAKAAGEQYPVLSVPEALVAAIVNSADKDLWLVIRLLAAAGSSASAPEAAAHLRELKTHVADEYCSVLEDSSLARRDSVGRLAVLSYIGLHAREGLLDDLPEEVLRRLAAARGQAGAGWRIGSIFACNSLLDWLQRKSNAKQIEDVLVVRLQDVIMRLLSGGDDPAGVIAVLQRASRYLPGEGGRLLHLVQVDVARAASQWVDAPVPLARLITLVDGTLPTSLLQELVARLARQLIDPAADRLTPHQLGEALQVVHQKRRLLQDHSGPRPIRDLFSAVLEEFGPESERLAVVLRNVATPSARASLLPVLRRLYGQRRFSDLVLETAEDFLHVAPPINPIQYRAVLDMIDELSRARPGGHRLEASVLPGVVTMVERQPKGSNLESYLAWSALRMRCSMRTDEWDTMLPQLVTEIQYRLPKSPLSELIRGISLVRDVYPRAAAQLLRALRGEDLVANAGKRLRQMPPSQVEQILLGFARLSAPLAYQALYPNGLLDAAFARALADDLHRLGEVKSTGKLLEVCNRIDAIYRDPGTGFAHLLAEHLGIEFVDQVLENEPRATVVFNLVRQLLLAQASYMDKVLDRVLARIKGAIRDDNRASAPQLALALATDAPLAMRRSVFDELVEDHGFRRKLGKQMQNASREDALRAFHHLGNALDPALAVSFTQAFEAKTTAFGRLISGRQPEVVVLLRAASAVTPTLRRGGLADAPRQASERAIRIWVELERQPTGAGDLAESLRLLRAVDPDSARRVVEDSSSLLDEIAHAPHHVTACQLLTEVDNAVAGMGRQLIGQLEENGTLEKLLDEVALDLDAHSQALSLRQLSELAPEYLNADFRERVHSDWYWEITKVRAPIVLGDLLRLFAMWDADLAHQVATRVEWQAVAQRVAHGALFDLESIAALISASWTLGFVEQAANLSRALRRVEDLPRRLPLESVGRLLNVVDVAEPALARDLAGQWQSRIAEVASTRYVIDDAKHWLGIGWSAYHSMRLGYPIDVPVRPLSLDTPLAPIIRLWGLGWLAPRDWIQQEFAVVFDEQVNVNVAPQRSSSATALLTLASRRGQFQRLVDAGTPHKQWAVVGEAKPGALRPLVEAAVVDPVLMAFLEPWLTSAGDRLSQPRWRTEVDALIIRRQLQL